MKTNLLSVKLSYVVATVLSLAPLAGRAQSVLVNGTLTDVPAGGGVFDYTLTLQNTGSEPVESLWVGWIPGSFNVANPSSAGNLQGWSSSLDGSSIQYGGTVGSAIAPGQSGTFTFASTTTPAEFQNQTAQAGQSTAYGIDAANGQLSFTLSGANTETFGLKTVPEPSSLSLLGLGAIGFLKMLRRKAAFAPSRV